MSGIVAMHSQGPTAARTHTSDARVMQTPQPQEQHIRWLHIIRTPRQLGSPVGGFRVQALGLQQGL